MKQCSPHRLPVAAFLAAAMLSPAAAAGESDLRTWTLEDLVEVPEVAEIAVARDERFALYAAEIGELETNRVRMAIRLVDLSAKTQRTLVKADAAKLLKAIPGTEDWSGLLDLGEGLQLYRIARSGKISPLMVAPHVVRVGPADMSVPIGSGTHPARVGVLAYDWSPDGRWLWYSLLKPAPDKPRVRFDAEVGVLRGRKRSRIEADVEVRLRGPTGEASLVITLPSSDRMAVYAGSHVVWRGDEIEFRVDRRDGSAGGAYETRAWNRRQKTMRTVGSERDLLTVWLLKGPKGGALATSGTGGRVELAETLPGGKQYSYGQVPFTIGDPRGAAYKLSPDTRRAIVGTRYFERARYGLAVIDLGGVREIGSASSLTRCDYGARLTMAVCIEEGMTEAPRLVRVDLEREKIEPILPVSSSHAAIAPLDIRPRTWVNRLGFKASGYVVLPRSYHPGRSYPTIIVTHGVDADERFANAGNQWNYPVQQFAERGYVVLLINDPWPQQSPELQAAFNAWLRGAGPPGPDEMQRLLWISGTYSFEDAVKEMAAEGLVDAARVGIAGYSRGSQMVNVAVTRSSMYRAASSGDGGFLEPAGYSSSRASYNAIYGGPPLGPHHEAYLRFAPSLNANRICTPVLQQVAAASPQQLDYFEALRSAKVPTQISFYPGASAASDETHVFHIPWNRLQAMRENIAWFDYWLLGKRDTGLVAPERLASWEQQAAETRKGCAQATP